MSDEAQSTLRMNMLVDGLAVGELIEPGLPEATADVKDTTAQNNIGGIATSLVGLIKHGEMPFKILYTGSTAQETLRTEIYDRENHVFTVVMPTTFHGGGHSFSFTGQFTKSAPTVNGTDPATLDFSATCNTKPNPVTTWAAGLTTPFFSIAEENANPLTPVPAAAAAVYDYQIEAYSDNTWIKVTPTATAGTIYVNGTVVATGVASGEITLNTGTAAVTYVSIVVTELNKTPKIYWLRVYLGTSAHP